MSTIVTTSHSRLTLEIHAPAAHFTLVNPPQNVIDFQMMDELRDALSAIEREQDISVIVFQGTGQHFSAGVDIPSHVPGKASGMLEKFHGVIMAIAQSKKITIAGVKGNCLGGGAELALICDMVFTSSTARWGFPEIKLACYPPVAAVALAAAVGQKRAAELVFTGRTISGDEAAQMGLANAAVTESELSEKLNHVVQGLTELSPAALRVAKKAFYAWDSIHLDKGLAKSEKIYLDELIGTQDMEEGIRAWMEKRKPMWRNK